MELPQILDEEWRMGAALANFRAYLYYAAPRFAYAWDSKHIRYLCEKLQAVEEGKIKRLMIFMPPRHFKSQTASVHFPAWFLGRNPHKRVIVTSYASSLATGFSRRSRSLTEEFGDRLFGIKLSTETSAKDQWEIVPSDADSAQKYNGGLTAVGVGGSLTGKGADILIIDDPHKDRKEANSELMRQNVWEWYASTAYTRLEPDGAIIVIQTRWHEEDLSGRLLAAMGSDDEFAEQWEVVNFPALADNAEDVLGREEGDPLWPERFDETRLAQIRTSVGPYEWASLYQQNPHELGSAGFKAEWLQWYTKNEISYHNEQWYFHDEPLTVYQGVDPAISMKTEADDFVVFTLGVTQTNKIVLLDPFAEHLHFNDQIRNIVIKWQEWGATQVGLETNAYQDALRQGVITAAMVPVKQLNHTGDKYTRIMSMVPYFANHQVYCRRALPDEPFYVDNVRLPNMRIHKKFQKFFHQAVTYSATSAHDDILDALENAISIAKPKHVANAEYKFQ